LWTQAVILTLCHLIIENRLYIKIKSDKLGEAVFFKTEKVVYIIAIIMALTAYMISMVNAASFWDIAHTSGAAPAEAQLTYKLLFFLKLIEIVVNLLFFIMDEFQSYTKNNDW
jgi:hypothetical protein